MIGFITLFQPPLTFFYFVSKVPIPLSGPISQVMLSIFISNSELNICDHVFEQGVGG